MGQLLVAFRGTANNDNNNSQNAATPPAAGLRRLFALLSAFLPFGQQQTDNLEPPRNRDGTNQQQGESAAETGRLARVGFGRRRRRHVPATNDLSGSGEAGGGRGSPNSGGGGPNGGSYFGSHFLMGGELYDSSKPEVFLFGDQQDLELLGNKSVKFPFSAKGVTDSVGVLNALVNVRKDSVKFTKIGRADGGYSSGFYRLEFIFDCDVSCFVQIHFCAREHIDEQQPQLFQIVSRQPQFENSERFHFPVGAHQQFSHFTFKPHRYDMKMMHWDGGPFFPVVIEIRSVSDQFPEQVQTTLCSIERSNDQSAVLILKPMKQKLFSDGVTFLLQEIFGIENKENAETAPPAFSEENGAECIICMANSRDTVILPCRHLCICNGCAETLRYKLNNCPICRSPFKALLKIKATRNSLIGQGVGSDGSMTTTRIRREPMTLIEAINGPFSSSATAPPLKNAFSAVGIDSMAQPQQNETACDGGEEKKAAMENVSAGGDDEFHHKTPPAASMVARCRGSQIVTSTVVHPSPPPSLAPVSNCHHKMPLFVVPSQNSVMVVQQKRHQMVPLADRRESSSRRDVLLIGGGEAMAGTAAVIDWLRGVKSPQQNDQMNVRNEALEHIEMGQLRSRKGSHSSAVHCRSSPSPADNNSFFFASRSPSLCHAENQRNSHFSMPNSSYQSACSFATKNSGGGGNIGQKELDDGQTERQRRHWHLGSSPNLVTLTEATKQRKRSETMTTERGARRSKREKEGRGHAKRRSDTPRGDLDDGTAML